MELKIFKFVYLKIVYGLNRVYARHTAITKTKKQIFVVLTSITQVLANQEKIRLDVAESRLRLMVNF